MYDPDFDWDEVDAILNATRQPERHDDFGCDAPPERSVATLEPKSGCQCECPAGHGDVCDTSTVDGIPVLATRNSNSDYQADCCALSNQPARRWIAHAGQVNVISFDVLSRVPRLYTGCWDEAKLKCWEFHELHQSDDCVAVDNRLGPLPRLTGEMAAGGFLNDFATISEQSILLAVSPGLIPTPGESMQVYKLSSTPFRLSDANADRLPQHELESQSNSRPGGVVSCIRESPQKIFLHTRGCRAVTLWPKFYGCEVVPQFVGSISKDKLGVSRIALDGCAVQQPEIWSVHSPHGMTEVSSVCFETQSRIWSGGNDGVLKLWDVGAGLHKSSLSVVVSPGAWTRKVEFCNTSTLLVAAHSDGLTCVDPRLGKALSHLAGDGQAYVTCNLEHFGRPHSILVGLGRQLVSYDLRLLATNRTESAALGRRNLASNVVGMHCRKTDDMAGNTCVAVGCKDGSVSLFELPP